MGARTVLVPLAAVLVLGGAACGSSSSSSGSTSPSASTPTSTPPASSQSSVSNGSEFCGEGRALIKDVKVKLAALASITSTPERTKKQLQTFLSAYKKAKDDAPAEIQPDIGVFYELLTHLNQIYAAHNYDPMATAAEAGPLFDSAKVKTAGAHLTAWAAANCGA